MAVSRPSPPRQLGYSKVNFSLRATVLLFLSTSFFVFLSAVSNCVLLNAAARCGRFTSRHQLQVQLTIIDILVALRLAREPNEREFFPHPSRRESRLDISIREAWIPAVCGFRSPDHDAKSFRGKACKRTGQSGSMEIPSELGVSRNKRTIFDRNCVFKPKSKKHPKETFLSSKRTSVHRQFE